MPSPVDARRQRVRITAKDEAACARLERGSTEEVGALLDAHGPRVDRRARRPPRRLRAVRPPGRPTPPSSARSSSSPPRAASASAPVWSTPSSAHARDRAASATTTRRPVDQRHPRRRPPRSTSAPASRSRTRRRTAPSATTSSEQTWSLTLTPMDRDQLRALQAPLKDQYRTDPDAARITLKATGTLGEGISCSVDTGRAIAEAGLHPATGGDGSLLCSGDMLLEALVACAGVTLARRLDLAGHRRQRAAACTPRATSTSAARSASTARRPSGFREHPAALRARHRRRRRAARHAAQADRALLRRLPDAGERPAARRHARARRHDGVERPRARRPAGPPVLWRHGRGPDRPISCGLHSPGIPAIRRYGAGPAVTGGWSMQIADTCIVGTRRFKSVNASRSAGRHGLSGLTRP